MAVLKYADRVAESTVTNGTGDIELAGAIDTDHATFGSRFADGEEMPVSVFGGGKWMTFRGRYNAGANSITRVTFRASSTGTNLSLSGTMTVMCGWAAADAAAMIRTDEAQSLSTGQKTQAMTNLGMTATGRALATAVNAADARDTIGATTVGSSLLTASDAVAARTAIDAVGVLLKVTVFPSTATWTKDAKTKFVIAKVWGGGGGSGGCANTGNDYAVTGGGGGGGYAEKKISSPGSTETVTVGAGGAAGAAAAPGGAGGDGGTSSFGAWCSASGGKGTAGSVNAGGLVNAGGAPGVGSGGDVNMTGQAGADGWGATNIGIVVAGAGGSAAQGGGGGKAGLNGNNGSAGGFPGGGAGGASNATLTGTRSGSAGGAGLVIVEEYC